MSASWPCPPLPAHLLLLSASSFTLLRFIVPGNMEGLSCFRVLGFSFVAHFPVENILTSFMALFKCFPQQPMENSILPPTSLPSRSLAVFLQVVLPPPDFALHLLHYLACTLFCVWLFIAFPTGPKSPQGQGLWLSYSPSNACHLEYGLPERVFSVNISSVRFSSSVKSNSLRPHEPLHARPPYPSPAPRVHPNPCPLSRWCHPTILSSVIPFSTWLQSFSASVSFPMSQFIASGGQSIGVSASVSVFPVNIQDWFPLGWTGWISLQSKGLSRVFSNTTVQKHQLFCAQLSV